MTVQDFLDFFEIGQNVADLGPEVLAVIHFAQVRNDVIDNRRRKVDQAPVQHDMAVAGARAPTGSG